MYSLSFSSINATTTSVSDTGKSLQEREKDGTGLRLRSCRAIVDLHEGGMLPISIHSILYLPPLKAPSCLHLLPHTVGFHSTSTRILPSLSLILALSLSHTLSLTLSPFSPSFFPSTQACMLFLDPTERVLCSASNYPSPRSQVVSTTQ